MKSINPFRTILPDADAVYHCAKRSKASVCSFDFFDTLAYRTTFCPNDVFRLQAKEIAPYIPFSSPDDWVKIRKDAEHDLSDAAHPAEVTLDDIYTEIAKRENLSQEAMLKAKQVELDLEKAVIKPYKDLIDVLGRLHAEGMKIVIMTDTYLPQSFMEDRLKDFCPFDVTLLCSSETKMTKRAGQAYKLLEQKFAHQKICHFGDNEHSDLVKSYLTRIKAFQVRWKRQSEVNDNKTLLAYAKSCGFTKLQTPYDGITTGPKDFTARDAAFLWSPVLADFILSIKEYADKISATDIWFLSRDGETMFKAAQKVKTSVFPNQTIQYLYGSRKCIYPLLMLTEPEKYKDYARTDIKPGDLENSKILHEYFRSHLTPESKRVLMIDIGWMGRLQESLSSALCPDVDLYGFYFSMAPQAAKTSRQKADMFVNWDKSVFYQSVVEAFSGYEEPSAEGIKREGKGFSPIFRKDDPDRSPPGYAGALEDYIKTLIEGCVARKQGDFKKIVRKAYVRRLSFFPQFRQSKLYEEWIIGAKIDGTSTNALRADDARGFFWELFKRREEKVVYWPSVSVSVLSKNSLIGRAVQTMLYSKMRLIQALQK